MLPVKFDGANIVFGASQAELYEPLPAQLVKDRAGTVLMCWQLSLEDRQRLLAGGPLWLSVQTHHMPLQPLMLSTERPTF